MPNIKTYFFLISFLCICISAYAHAQDLNIDFDTSADTMTLPPVMSANMLPEAEMLPNVKLEPKTHPEKIVFAQIKLANKQADIESMAKASPFVASAQDIDKSAMLIAEYNRINDSYNIYDKNSKIVVLSVLKADEYSSLQNMIVFDELDDTTFFNFSMYGYNVGIVPEDVAKFSKLALSKPRAERMFSLVNDSKNLVVEFILQPTYADSASPFIMNEKDYWLMFAKIAEFRLWSSDNPEDAQLLWYYRSDWYKPKDNKGINNLDIKDTNG